jgi:hypothetical protein
VDKKAMANKMGILLGIGGSLMVLPIMWIILYPPVFDVWLVPLAVEVIGFILIIVAVKLAKKHQIPWNKKISGL